MNNIKSLLKEFVYDVDDPHLNFKIGYQYEMAGHYSGAISHYLKCVDSSKDKPNTLLQYEAIIRMAKSLEQIKGVTHTIRSLYKQAISLLPDRPEAYYLLSVHYEMNEYSGHWIDCYFIAKVGSVACNPAGNMAMLQTDVGYRGYYCLIFQQGIAAWWCGLYDESRRRLMDVEKWNGVVDKQFKDVATYNLDNNIGRNFKNMPYLGEIEF